MTRQNSTFPRQISTPLDLSSAYRFLTINHNSNSNSLTQNSFNNHHRSLEGSRNYHRHPIGSLTSLANHYTSPNTVYPDSPPPYSLISPPPPYSLHSDLLFTELFRALFHFPDSHPFLFDYFNFISPQFPDSALSHLIAFPPQYEPGTQSIFTSSEGQYTTIFISVRERKSS